MIRRHQAIGRSGQCRSAASHLLTQRVEDVKLHEVEGLECRLDEQNVLDLGVEETLLTQTHVTDYRIPVVEGSVASPGSVTVRDTRRRIATRTTAFLEQIAQLVEDRELEVQLDTVQSALVGCFDIVHVTELDCQDSNVHQDDDGIHCQEMLLTRRVLSRGLWRSASQVSHK